MIRFTIILSCFSLVVFGQGFWNLELSPNSICIVRYQGAYISVWQDSRQPGRYYAMPIVYLQEDTAQAILNKLTGEAEMRFEVIMWSVEAHEVVYRHIKTNINNNVTETDLELIPFDHIRLVWKSTSRPIDAAKYRLVDDWKSNTHLPHVVQFQFECTDLSTCQTLQTAMKDNPIFFDGLELEYVVNGQKTARRQITILGTHVVHGKLFSQLLSMPNVERDERFINIQDMKQIISETTYAVMATVVTDAEYVDTGDEISVKELLEREFKRHEVSTEVFEPHMWDSVFWDPTWARPDKLTSYLNQVLTKDQTDDRYFLLQEGKRISAREGGGQASFLGIKLGGYGKGRAETQYRITKESIEKMLKERKYHVQWTGDVFRTKPMTLYRLNLSQLSNQRRVLTVSVQVKKYEHVQRIKLRVTETGDQTIMLTPQLLEKRLQSKVEQMKNDLTKMVTATTTDFQTRLSQSETKLAESQTKMENLDRGTTYIRWGRTTCPDTNTELVYHGYVGGGQHNHKGGGGDLVCLTRTPDKIKNPTPAQDTHAYIYGSEYQVENTNFFNLDNSPNKGPRALHDQDIPCAVCRTNTRPSKVMIPGRKTCDGTGWTREYYGYLMTAHWQHASLNHVCVDIAPEPLAGGQANHDGAILYIVQAHCGSLRCPPYTQNYELTCVVCTK